MLIECLIVFWNIFSDVECIGPIPASENHTEECKQGCEIIIEVHVQVTTVNILAYRLLLGGGVSGLSLIYISVPTRQLEILYAGFGL